MCYVNEEKLFNIKLKNSLNHFIIIILIFIIDRISKIYLLNLHENGSDIDRYIKKTHGSKSKLKPDFLFSKTKEEKKPKENGGSETVLNKDTEFLA